VHVELGDDPLVLAHARALLTSAPPGVTAYVDADLRDPAAILRAAAGTLDFTEPVALVLLGILNFIDDTDEAVAVVDQLLDAVPAGSYLALTHPTLELGGEANTEAMRFWNQRARPPITARSGAEVARFLERVELVPPGLVSCTAWRPDPAPDDAGGPAEVLAAKAALRDEIDAARPLLEAAVERAATLPHRERYLRLVHRLGSLLLDAHAQWLDEVERELDPS